MDLHSTPPLPVVATFALGLTMPVWVVDGKGSGLRFNQAWLDVVGVSLEQALGFGWIERTNPEDHARLLHTIAHAMASSGAWPFEARFSTRDGWTWIHGMCVREENACVCLATAEASPEALLPKHLPSARTLLSQLLETAPDQILLHDLQGRCLFANASASHGLAKNSTTMNGPVWNEAGLSPEAGHAFERRFHKVLKQGKPIRGAVSTPGEKPQQLDSILSPIFDSHGRIGAVLNILRSTTEPTQHEKALRESEATYRGIFDSIREAIYVQDRKGRFLDVNRGAMELYGQPKDFFIGQTPEVVSAPGMNNLGHIMDLVQRALAGEPQRLEFWGIRSDGEVFPKEVRLYKGTYLGQDAVIAMSQDITERKRAEAALQASGQHFRELLERLQEGFAFADTEERFVLANPAASAIFGVPGDLVGRSLRDFVTPEVFEQVMTQSEFRRRGEKGSYDLPIRRPDGEIRLLSLSVSPWLDEQGNYIGSSGLFQDITEQRQAETALRESEGNFRNLLDKLGEGFAVVDPEERWSFANPASARIFGVKPGQLVGRSIREFVDDATYQEILRQTALRREGKSSTYEIEVRRPDGERRHVQLSAYPFLGENGEFLGADGLFTDITERKQAELALRESQERYLELFSNTTDAIFWIRVELDGSFVVESINPAEESILGKKNAEVAGKSIRELLPAHMAAPVEEHFRACIAAGHPVRFEEEVSFPDGSMTFLTQLVPIRDAHQRIVRIVGFSQDITQHKRAEEALRQAQKLESLGVLAGGIAHDFNNLLTAMLGNLNLAQMQSSPESPALPCLENVERAILKAAELIKQMLAYSGKGRFVVKPHDMNQVVREMTHLLNVSISKKALIRYNLALELPLIEADAAQIQQVVMNLVINASEAIGDREGVIGLTTRMQTLDEKQLHASFAGQSLNPGTHVVLEISDTGSGIPPDIMGKIFDPFFTTKQSGRGLGLSAMLGILRGHHAGLQMASEQGKGTTFSLFFPAAVGSAVQPSVSQPNPSRERLKGRVLLADDEPEVLHATEAMLMALGLQVVTAVDGRDALDHFMAEIDSFDLVLLDLIMPRMDGRETFAELRRARADIPVILYSGYSEQEFLQDILTKGFAGFLQKPFHISDLQDAIRQVLVNR